MRDYKQLEKQVFSNITAGLPYNQLSNKVYEIIKDQIDADQFNDFFQWIEIGKVKIIGKTVKHADNLIISCKYFRQALDIAIVQELMIDAYMLLGHDINFKWNPMNRLVSDFNYLIFKELRYAMGYDNPPVKMSDNTILKFASTELRSRGKMSGVTDAQKAGKEKTLKKKKDPLKKKIAHELLKNLEDDNYDLSDEDIETQKHTSFKGYRSQYIKRMTKNFDDVFKLLESETKIPIDKFDEYIDPPSQFYRIALINSFQWHCNDPKGDFHKRCRGKKLHPGKMRIKGESVDAIILYNK